MSTRYMRFIFLLMSSILYLSTASPLLATKTLIPWLSDPNVLTCGYGDCVWAYSQVPDYTFTYPPGTLFMFAEFNPTPSNMIWTPMPGCTDSSCTWLGTGSVAGYITGYIENYYTGITISTFNGSITGGDTQGMEWQHPDGSSGFYYEMGYQYSGQWTNSYVSSGSGYYDVGSDGTPSGDISMQTYSPEPGTLLTLGTGVIGLAGLARRRLFI